MSFINTMAEVEEARRLEEAQKLASGNAHQSPDTTCASQDSVIQQAAKISFISSADVEADPKDAKGEHTAAIDSRRKFRLVGIKFDSTWSRDESLKELMALAQSFHLWFDPVSPTDPSKLGGMSLTFETIDQAKSAFSWAQNIFIDGVQLKIQASKSFYETETPESKEDRDPDIARRLYVTQLLPSADETLIMAVFGTENVASVQLSDDKSRTDGSRLALVTFTSKEMALQAKRELNGFAIDDGDGSRPMRLLTAAEYLHYIQSRGKYKDASKRKSGGGEFTAAQSTAMVSDGSVDLTMFALLQDTPLSPDPSPEHITGGSVASELGSRPRPPSSPTLAPDTSVEDMAALIEQFVVEQRTNWAELNDVDELWVFIDGFSAQRGGVPDNLLKPALLLVLERHLANTQADWMHRHLTDLVRAWKRETAKEKSDPRPTAVQMAAPSYSPPPETRKRGVGADRKRKLAGLMGVGALLTNARERFGNEEGELQDEDVWVGGQNADIGAELSWESWSALSGEKAAANAVSFKPLRRVFAPTTKKTWRPPPSTAATASGSSAKQPSTPPVEGNRKKTTAREKKTSFSDSGEGNNTQTQELEEGEMTSSAGSSADSGSSSSGDSSSSEANSSSGGDKKKAKTDKKTVKSRERRRHRRQEERKKKKKHGKSGGNDFMQQMMGMMSQMYQSRMQMVQHMNPQQKQHMANMLRQMQGGQMPNMAGMMQMMQGFGGQQQAMDYMRQMMSQQAPYNYQQPAPTAAHYGTYYGNQ